MREATQVASSAALSGSHHKAPGFAEGYLLRGRAMGSSAVVRPNSPQAERVPHGRRGDSAAGLLVKPWVPNPWERSRAVAERRY